MTPRLTKSALAAGGLLLGMQLIRPAFTNPPVDPAQTLDARMPSSGASLAVINRSCRDCHSSETTWPWYSKVAPVSWLLARDVNDGRRQVNFSNWGTYPPERQRKLLKEACNEVTKGDMPMWIYTVLHRGTTLSAADVRAVCALADAPRG